MASQKAYGIKFTCVTGRDMNYVSYMLETKKIENAQKAKIEYDHPATPLTKMFFHVRSTLALNLRIGLGQTNQEVADLNNSVPVKRNSECSQM